MIDAGNFPIDNFLQPIIDLKVGRPGRTEFVDVRALIDTGSMRSAISRKIVEELELLPCGTTEVSSPFESRASKTLVGARVRFSFNYEFPEVAVIEMTDSDIRPYNAVIGMDILSAGDLLITNANDKMILSLRFPAAPERIMFGQED